MSLKTTFSQLCRGFAKQILQELMDTERNLTGPWSSPGPRVSCSQTGVIQGISGQVRFIVRWGDVISVRGLWATGNQCILLTQTW